MPRVLAFVIVVGTAVPAAHLAQAPERVPARETALDRYVAAPDQAFGWKVLKPLPAAGAAVTVLEMTSQRWLTEREVQQPLWTHWITVARPASVASDIGLLFISGGSNDKPAPAKAPGWLVDIARETQTVTAELRLIPNQPVVFSDDPGRKPRFEDDFIAYTWDKFLRTGDPKWPARLPMTKAAVRAMDAVTAFTASPGGGSRAVTRFVVSGASKRGWTTWMTAAVDPRVVAIAPAVIDLLNVERSFVHHWQAYGAWSPAVQDYVDHGIMNWMGTPEFRRLMELVEPFEYRERFTMPKYILNASGDEFFLPDSSQFYFDALPGEKHLRYVPNAAHSLEKTDAIATLHAFYASIVAGRPRPRVTWRLEPDGAVTLTTADAPQQVLLWQATNPTSRDFRLDTIGPAWRSTPLAPARPGTWIARVTKPDTGWTAFFVELTYPGAERQPLKITTGVQVVPDTLPFPPPAKPSKAHSTNY